MISASAIYCSRISKRVGQIFLHNFTLPNIPKPRAEPFGWQLQVLDIIDKPPHPRHINWFWERNGGVGKSELAIWLYVNRNALVCMGKAQDIFHVIAKEPTRREIIIFDITKEKMEHFCYSNLELIKNGYIMSGKYDSSIVYFDRPHVIVFANTPPDYSKMTNTDRWNVIKIEVTQPDQNTSQSSQLCTLHELLEIQ